MDRVFNQIWDQLRGRKAHFQAFSKFNLLDNFLFVLDGDARNMENTLQSTAKELGSYIKPLFLPGDVPEQWAWDILNRYTSLYATLIGISENDLKQQLNQFDQLFSNATDKPTNIIKNKFRSFCDRIKQSETELMRKIARKEGERQSPEIKIFMDEFELQLRNWQSRNK